MIGLALIEAYLVRILPSIVYFMLSLRKFNYLIMAKSVKAYADLCPESDIRLERDFPCLRPGATALTTLNAAISIGLSFLISALLKKELLPYALCSGILMLVSVLIYVCSLEHEGTRIETLLVITGHQRILDCVGPIANLFSLVVSVLIAHTLVS